MTSEISSLDQLVRSVVATKAEFIDHCHDHYSGLVAQMNILADITRENTLQKILDIADDQQREIFIQLLQRRFVSLSDELVSDYTGDLQTGFQVVAGEITKANMLKEFYACLQKLLSLLTRNFPRYICPDTGIPLVAKRMIAGGAKKMLKDVEKRFRDTGVNEQLSELIMDVIMENIDGDSLPALTFRRTDWLLNFLRNVRDILKHKPDTAQRQLHMLLCTHNLNHEDVLEYCKNTIHSKIDCINSPAGKIDKLALIRKRINQFTYIDDVVYDTSLPDMKEQLNNWISEEIHYLQNHMLLGLPQPETPETTSPESFKIQFGLNAQELASLMNIAETVGVVKTRNKSNFMRTASQMFATINQEVIDPDSLRTLYYKNSKPVLEAVRDKIVDMMNETNKRLARTKK